MSDHADVDITTTTTLRRRRRACGLTLDRALQIFSSLLIPLLLSIFTVVIAIYQQKVASDNRQIDINNTEAQRERDQYIAERQREIDYNISIQQQKEDQEDREEQWDQDRKQAELQRETDMNMTTYQLEQELLLDEDLRSIAAEEKNKTLASAENITQEDILQKFVREMSTLIGNANNDISMNMLYTIRWKVLVAIRQLDSERKTLIIKNLYEVGLLDMFSEEDNRIPVDLSEGHFDEIDLSTEPIEESRSLSFRGMSLINAKFDNNNLPGSDFGFTQLIGSSFRNSILEQSTFYSANLRSSSFINANIQDCDFTDAILIGSDITKEQLNSVLFLDGAILPDEKEKFEHYNLLWVYPSSNDDENVIRPYNNYQKANFSDVWYVYKDIITDPEADIEEIEQWKCEAKAQYRVSLKSIKRRIPGIYEKWIKQNNLNMKIKTLCGTYGQNTTLSYFIYHYDINNNSSFNNYTFGPISGSSTGESIDFVPISSELEYELEFVFERSEPIESAEKIGFCKNISLSFVIKRS